MKYVTKIWVIVMVAMVLSACGGQNDEKVKVVASDSMAAEELALAGEQLVTPATFMLANTAFEMALAKDPNNLRAKFCNYSPKFQ